MLSDLINQNYSRLNETDLYSLNYIMEHISQIERLNIEALAEKCSTSKSSVLRLTQKLGFSGYSEFKNYLKWETRGTDFDGEELYRGIREDFESTCRHINNSEDLKKSAEKIRNSEQVFVYGSGQAQRYCAMELQRLFMQVGKYVYYVGASEEFRLLTQSLERGSVVIILSLCGDLKKMKDAAQIMKVKGVTVISITNFCNNPLSALADYRLYAVSSEIKIEGNLIHNSFVNYLVVIEYLFRKYLEISSAR